jgi:hypothetical protein
MKIKVGYPVLKGKKTSQLSKFMQEHQQKE